MKNVEIYINGNLIITDDRTDIGTIIQNFDFTDPGNRKELYTNVLLLPYNENAATFEFCDSPGYTGSLPYDRNSIKIFVEGYRIIRDGIGYIEKISDGYIHFAVVELSGIIQDMKDTKLSALYSGWYRNLGATATTAVQGLLNATSDVKLDFILNETQRTHALSNPTEYKYSMLNSNLTCYVKDIFTQIETLLGITFAGSLLTDTYFQDIRTIVAKSVISDFIYPAGPSYRLRYISLNYKKTVWDLFKAVLQVFGAVYTISGTTVTVEKLDDKTLTILNWSGKVNKIIEKKFTIEGLAKTNYMRFNAQNDASDDENESVWTCNNKNIESEVNLIEPDVVVYPFIEARRVFTSMTVDTPIIFMPDSDMYQSSANISARNTIADIVFVIDGTYNMPIGTVVKINWIAYYLSTKYTGELSYTTVSGDDRVIASYYNSQNDYLLFQAMISDPVVYEVEIDLNVLDLHDYNPNNLVRIPELGGVFFVNKLQYNFDKRGEASKVTLIKYVPIPT